MGAVPIARRLAAPVLPDVGRLSLVFIDGRGRSAILEWGASVELR